MEAKQKTSGADWKNCYHFLPWEDWRDGRPAILDEVIIPALMDWINQNAKITVSDGYANLHQGISNQVKIAFGLEGIPFDEERVLERYELIYTAGLANESNVDRGISSNHENTERTAIGHSMLYDHRRILATALARLRSKLKYRPVIFELMPDEFTLLLLQQTVESILGRSVHKQNFRRLVESNKLVEPTGKSSLSTGGRPAALFKFRREVMAERPAPGLRLGR